MDRYFIMALVHPASAESTQSGLDLFEVPPTQTAVIDGYFEENNPLSALSEGAPIQFSVKGDPECYIDMQNTFLHVKAKITKADGTNLDAGTDVAPVNYWLHGLFSQVDVYLNGVLISSSDNTYPFRSYITALLTTGREAKRGAMTSELFYRDSSNHLDDTTGNDNKGLSTRRAMTSGSKEVDLMGPLHVDICQQSRYLLPQVTVQINLHPSKSEFNLIADDATRNFKTIITHASLHVRKAKMNPGISLAHEKVLMKTNAKYPIKRMVSKVFGIPGGQLSHVQDNLFQTQSPSRLFVTIVDTDAFGGNYKKNPYHFKHQNLNFLSLYLDGKNIPGGKPLTPDFNNHQYVQAYHSLMSALGLVNNVEGGSVLEYRDFELGYAIYGFDLSPSLSDGDCFELVKTGALRLELKFSEQLANPVNVLCLGVLDSIIEIDKARQIIKDY